MPRARVLIFAIAWIACSGRDAMRPPPTKPAGAGAAAPSIRLPDGVTPLGYDLRLEVDPDSDSFRGSVDIRARLDAPTDRFWIHADELSITSARSGLEPLVALPLSGDQMRAYGFGRTLPAGEVTLSFEFTGSTAHDEEGLFRQDLRGAWYLFSQGESVFARRILPCFDEPRFKVPWRVTLVVPEGAVALANTPQASERKLSDGRREVVFAPTPPMPSYLLALAVGPFELVDAGTVGRGHVPVRVAALRGDRARVGVVAAELPPIVAALEDYLDRPLPLAKLDLVAVPHLFGAMENPGLVTFDTQMLAGEAQRKGFRDLFVHVAAHELAHQWFGNAVTPAWWDDLWLSEAFASWLSDKVADKLGAFDDPTLRAALQREQALEADDEPEARSLRHAVARNDDPDTAFDTISYEKGAAVLSTIEHWIGEAAMREGLRAYLTRHADGVATTADLIAAVEHATRPEVSRVLATYVEQPGAPLVELSVECTGKPRIIARARTGGAVPVCVRVGTSHGAVRECGVVGAHTELAVPECPTWLWGNDGAGYYHVATSAPVQLDALAPAEKIALADDLAAAFDRGELRAPVALARLKELASSDDGYAIHAAAAIARALDPHVPAASRAAWLDWLAKRFETRVEAAAFLTPRTAVDRRVREDLVGLIAERVQPQVAHIARRFVDADLARERDPDPDLVAFSSPDEKLFDAIVKLVRETKDPGVREGALASLGAFGPRYIERALDAFVTADLPRDRAWEAVSRYFARPATRLAAWQAVRGRLPALLAQVSGEQASMFLESAGELCDAASRAQVAAAFEPVVGDIVDGKRALARALARIDRCAAHAIEPGELAQALK